MGGLNFAGSGYQASMSDGCHTPHPRSAGDFSTVSRAEPQAVAAMTEGVRTWLGRAVQIDEVRTADITLATYEALANCADHAYRHAGSPGTMTVEATCDHRNALVRVCVTDEGSWVDPGDGPAVAGRGRGIRLMQALSDDCTVHGTDGGTTVCLHFEQCPLARAAHTDSARPGTPP
ncbi:ATP-binding protein [Mycobacterium sp. WMMD1722]|uniref:ATP-binding protein n=1 Tax=Mycobacterium sp. WMMD1722 TaxID=3404117 RepID=UPI003BF5355B